MSAADTHSSSGKPELDRSIRETAARWIVRRDRGLSATESIEFELWLAAEERHAAAVQSSATTWSMLDRIPDEIGRPLAAKAARRGHWRRFVVSGLAAAAALTIAYIGWTPTPVGKTSAPTVVDMTGPRILNLSDGTVVRLNTNSEVVEQFTPTERRVSLVRGEAHFTVTKNPARPFIVRAGDVEARAVGTAFNVNLRSTMVEVLVTEGRVQITSESAGHTTANETVASTTVGTEPYGTGFLAGGTMLRAGERAVVRLAPTIVSLQVVQVPPEEMSQALAWQEPLLRLGGATLAELAAEFQKRGGHRLIFEDTALAEWRIGGRFRVDDFDGFVRLLEENYGLKSERTSDGAISLRKAR